MLPPCATLVQLTHLDYLPALLARGEHRALLPVVHIELLVGECFVVLPTELACQRGGIGKGVLTLSVSLLAQQPEITGFLATDGGRRVRRRCPPAAAALRYASALRLVLSRRLLSRD